MINLVTKKIRDSSTWYFRPGWRMLVSIPLFIDTIFMMTIVLINAFVASINLWNLGGAIIYLTGVAEGIIAFLLLIGFKYINLPYDIEKYIRKKNIVINKKLRYSLIIIGMVCYRVFIALILVGYSKFI